MPDSETPLLSLSVHYDGGLNEIRLHARKIPTDCHCLPQTVRRPTVPPVVVWSRCKMAAGVFSSPRWQVVVVVVKVQVQCVCVQSK